LKLLIVVFPCPHFLNRDSPDEGMARIGAADRAAAFHNFRERYFVAPFQGLPVLPGLLPWAMPRAVIWQPFRLPASWMVAQTVFYAAASRRAIF